MFRTLMLTGDAKETAIAISRQIRLINDQSTGRGSAVSGSEIDRLTEDDLRTVVKSASVFYRVTPRHKVRIVKALQVRHLDSHQELFRFLYIDTLSFTIQKILSEQK